MNSNTTEIHPGSAIAIVKNQLQFLVDSVIGQLNCPLLLKTYYAKPYMITVR